MQTPLPVSPNPQQLPAVPLDGTATVVPITRGSGDRARTVGVVLVDRAGAAHWQRTMDVERLLTVAMVVTGAVAVHGVVAAALRRPNARVGRLTMGPGGWVSFKGGEKPTPHGPRRPWWAVALHARPLSEGRPAAPRRSGDRGSGRVRSRGLRVSADLPSRQ